MNAQKYLKMALVAIICVIVALVAYALFINESSREHIEKMEAAQYSVLKVSQAEYRTIYPSIKEGNITVKALWTVDVKAQHEGVLTDIFANVGQSVNEGALLARMTNEELGAQLASAEASIAEARAALLNAEQTAERYRRLIAYDAISRQEYDNSIAQRDAAKAQMDNRIAQRDMTQANMNKLDVYSSNSAVVVNVYHKTGDYVRTGEPIFLLSNFNELQAYAVMEHGELRSLLKYGRDFILEVPFHRLTHRIYPITQSPQLTDGLPLNQFPARMENIVPEISDSTKYHEVTWRITNSSAILEPTYYNDVTFSAVNEQKILAVPRDALHVESDKFYVYTVDADDYLRKNLVSVGFMNNNFVEITSGLKLGDLVVTNDRMGYTEGMKVRVDRYGGQP